MKNAQFWKQNTDDDSATCWLCAHRCRVVPGRRGVCGVRVNDGGKLYSSIYGRVIAEHIDPVEKKPLYHFLPSTTTCSVASIGCNFKCDFCQNWGISQASGIRKGDLGKQGRVLDPQILVEYAVSKGCGSISFTYSEPTVFFEYALDTAKIAVDAGLKTAFVSNGYMTHECLRVIKPYLYACNIDLKSFRDDFYKKRCGASLAPVLDTLKNIRAAGIWLEVTTLVIPGENDSNEELADIANFIVNELGADTPWHVSRFFPQYRMTGVPATDPSVIEKAVDIGRTAGLSYVYAGNVSSAQDTVCPSCGAVVIHRQGYRAEAAGLVAGDDAAGCCRACGAAISGVWGFKAAADPI
jgi:pyruvate formate lyase activating enzyme